MKYFILFGPPGAGKGTQATAMVEKYNLHHISTGALLRKEIAAGTELGLQAKALIEKGCLVPDEVVEGMIENEFKTVTGVEGFLLDGFPRTVYQAEKLDEFLAKHDRKVEHVLDIAVEKEELITRLTGRLVCRSCGASYHKVNMPPKTEGVCDTCGGELYQRADDTKETVENRIDVYESQTKPLVDFYEKAGVIAHIDGATGLDSVFADIVKVLG